MVLLGAVLLGAAACGGGGSGGGGGGGQKDPGTPAGTYAFQVAATTGTGANAITTSMTVNVTVK
jgi:hypothetical protein